MGANFSALNFNTYYFMLNSGSMVALFCVVFVVMFALSISSVAIKSLRQQCD